MNKQQATKAVTEVVAKRKYVKPTATVVAMENYGMIAASIGTDIDPDETEELIEKEEDFL